MCKTSLHLESWLDIYLCAYMTSVFYFDAHFLLYTHIRTYKSVARTIGAGAITSYVVMPVGVVVMSSLWTVENALLEYDTCINLSEINSHTNVYIFLTMNIHIKL